MSNFIHYQDSLDSRSPEPLDYYKFAQYVFDHDVYLGGPKQAYQRSAETKTMYLK